ncbi:MAG TPA: ThiF family adenylyltransferase, partial [Syntrophorhabdus sp.]|nr:ThiF family adenylyltransferase [Syntrophorhabdus sp.]
MTELCIFLVINQLRNYCEKSDDETWAKTMTNNKTAPFKYHEFVSSASAFITGELQEKIRVTKFLIAGNGSIGNPTAMALARSGAENITCADPETIETSNLARQEFFFNQVGRNKADITRQNILAINPNATYSVKSVSEGITYDNVGRLVSEADIIIDGIDICSSEIAWELHKTASMLRRPVIVGYDLAGTAMLMIIRYDLETLKPLNGDISEETIQEFSKVKAKYHEGKITESQYLDYVYQVLTGPINPLLLSGKVNSDKKTGRVKVVN